MKHKRSPSDASGSESKKSDLSLKVAHVPPGPTVGESIARDPDPGWTDQHSTMPAPQEDAESLIEQLPESMRWNPVPGSEGLQTIEPESEEEDAEGRSETEQLAERGSADAEIDRSAQAALKAAEELRDTP